MIKTIVDFLTESTGLKFIRHGETALPSSPYGVLKTEKIAGGRGVRVILHYDLGKQEALESKMREVIDLLEDRQFTNANGAVNRLGRMIDYTDVGPVSDDQTISMEALFKMPSTIF